MFFTEKRIGIFMEMPRDKQLDCLRRIKQGIIKRLVFALCAEVVFLAAHSNGMISDKAFSLLTSFFVAGNIVASFDLWKGSKDLRKYLKPE